jgi:NADPH:quinone reductase-like Zn-dependent oxidoreductase
MILPVRFMRALAFDSQSDVLKVIDVAVPEPGANEVLIEVHAAGVIPAELAWYPTAHTPAGAERSNAVLAHEFSGIVAAVGAAVADVRLGAEVYGMNDWFTDGSTADYCITTAGAIAPKPDSLTHEQAASVPISALTAWQGLYERAQLKSGEHVLVHGGAGAVGAYAVQLARLRGARITATASAQNSEYVLAQGAERVIDYHSVPFETVLNNVDVVFDTIGGETLARSWQVLKPGGRMVTVASSTESISDERNKQAFFIVEPNREQLSEIGQLIGEGLIRTAVAAIIPMDDAPMAYRRTLAGPVAHGKVIVRIK